MAHIRPPHFYHLGMADNLPFDPAKLEQLSFEMVRRGYDPAAVQQRLQQAAALVRSLQSERDALQVRLGDMEGLPSGSLEPHRIAEALGIEATRVLESAHAAAAERAERADREADAVREAALEAAEAVRTEVAAEREAAMEAARQEAERIVEDGRIRGLELVAEARIVRERMLNDLARKRKSGRTQVEQLRAARDRLLEALSVAQQGVDAAVRDLIDSVPEARAAAERVGLRMESEDAPSAEELEGEIDAARVVGHPLMEGIAEAVQAEAEATVAPDGLFSTGETAALTQLDAALEGPGDSSEAPFDHAAEEEPAPLADEEPAPPADEEPAPPVEPESGDEGDDSGGVGAIFARLRQAVPADTGSEDSSDSAVESEAPSDAAASPADDDDSSVDAPDTQDDDPLPSLPFEAEQAAAEAAVTKALKKVVVDEQGTLLDGIRQHGASAIHDLVSDAAAHAKPYEQASSGPLGDLAKALGGKVGQRKVGLVAIRSVGLDPLRAHLTELADQYDDPRELSDAVRSLYRDARSQGLADAAAASVNAVVAEVVGAAGL